MSHTASGARTALGRRHCPSSCRQASLRCIAAPAGTYPGIRDIHRRDDEHVIPPKSRGAPAPAGNVESPRRSRCATIDRVARHPRRDRSSRHGIAASSGHEDCASGHDKDQDDADVFHGRNRVPSKAAAIVDRCHDAVGYRSAAATSIASTKTGSSAATACLLSPQRNDT